MPQLVLALTYIIGCVALALRREKALGHSPGTIRGRARAVGWGILPLPLALMAGALFSPARGPIVILLLLAGIVAVRWPDVAAKVRLYGLALAAFWPGQDAAGLGVHRPF